MKRILTLISASIIVVACGQEEPVATEPLTPAGQAQQPAGQAQMPAGHPGPMTAPSDSPLSYDLPDGWNQQQPSSAMRLDQAVIPGPGGEGELAVFFFGAGGGGSVEANLDRWIGQMETTAEPTRESFEANGLKVTWIDASGTVNPSTTGMGPSTPQPGSRMFAAVVEGEGGPWFFKATGPADTMADARDEFIAMLQSAKLETGAPDA